MQHSAWLQPAWELLHRNQPGVAADGLFWLEVSADNAVDWIGHSAWFRQFSRGLNWWRLVGSGAVCSDYVSLPAKDGYACQVANATAKWFSVQPRKLLEAPIAIEIDGHQTNDPQWQAFTSALTDRGWTADSVGIESAWRADLPESWRDYELLLSKSRRRKVKRALKLRDQGELEFRILRSASEIDSAWPDFVRLHQMRRLQLGQPGCFADSHYEQFLKHAVHELARLGIAGLAHLSHCGQPIATLLIFDQAGIRYVYQSGIDTDQIDLEPGHMVNALMLHDAVDKGLRAVDFMRGDEHYKSGWKAASIGLSRTILLPPGLTSRGISSALKLKRGVQAWLKKSDCSLQSQHDAEEHS